MAALPPLADLTNVNGTHFVFDRGKISMVYVMPLVTAAWPEIAFTASPGILIERQTFEVLDVAPEDIAGAPPPGPMTTHVFGITAAPQPVGETPVDLLNRLRIGDKFALLTSLAGEIRVKATSVGWMLPKYPGVDNPRVHCVLNVGGLPQVVQICEDLPTVRARVDALRAQADGAALA